MIRNNAVKLAAIRSRLSDISWWMRLLSQNIAQRANRDDQEVGKFWQSRYRAVRLLDETAVLACAAYVDLNPIRAAMAETLEASDYTSVQRRVEAVQQVASAKATKTKHSNKTKPKVQSNAKRPDEHLAPIEINERRDATGPRCNSRGCRASDKGFLPIPTAAYLELLDWTARQIRNGKRGSTPKSAKPIFERLGISGEVWCELVKEFGRLFMTVAGKPQEIDSHRSRSGGRRYKVKPKARELMAA